MKKLLVLPVLALLAISAMAQQYVSPRFNQPQAGQVPVFDQANQVFTFTQPGTAASNGLLVGGGVGWSGANLVFLVSPASYRIAGQVYASALTTVTLSAADPTNPRIDAIILDDTGVATKITGTPAASPSAPTVDPTSQLFLTFVAVAANATTPSNIFQTIVYQENVEWTCAASGGTNNCASTNNPYEGTKDIEGTAAAKGDYFQLTNSSAITTSLYSTLVFFVRSKAQWAGNRSITITFQLSSATVGSAVVLQQGSFGFDSSNTSSYQQIVIPISAFGSISTADRIRFTVTGGGNATLGYYFDNIFLQSSLLAPSSVTGVYPIVVNGSAVSCPDCSTTPNSSVFGGIIGGIMATAVTAANSLQTMGNQAAIIRPSYSVGMLLSGPAVSANVTAAASIGRPFSAAFYDFSWTAADVQKYGDATTINPTATGWVAAQQSTSSFSVPAGMALSGITDGSSVAPALYWTSGVSGVKMQPMVSAVAVQNISTTKLFCAGGQQTTAPSSVACQSDEQIQLEPIPDSATATSLCAVISATTTAGGTFVVTLRKGTGANPWSAMADTALTISLGASTATGKYCSPGSVSYSGGDIWSVSAISNGGACACLDSIEVEFTPTAPNMRGWVVFPKGGKTIVASTNFYVPVDFNSNGGGASEITERSPWPRADKLQNYRCYLKTAPGSNTTTFKLDKNGSTSGTPNVSALTSSGNDVVISDTSTTLVMAALDGLDEEIAPGSGAVVSSPACAVAVYAQ